MKKRRRMSSYNPIVGEFLLAGNRTPLRLFDLLRMGKIVRTTRAQYEEFKRREKKKRRKRP